MLENIRGVDSVVMGLSQAVQTSIDRMIASMDQRLVAGPQAIR